jgi:pSer/pThr/pTyr-binding forkhead associated (FHA) protein
MVAVFPCYPELKSLRRIASEPAEPAELVVGRGPDCNVVLRNRTVSRRHAGLSRRWGRWVLDDLGSRNGTRVNGVPLDGPTEIAEGDEVMFGGAATAFAPGELCRFRPLG